MSEIASHFAKDVPYWITFNEPNLLRSSKPKIRRLKWEEQVAFSEDYFIARQQLLVGSSRIVADFQDLTGIEIVVVRGTTSEKNLPLISRDSQAVVLDDYQKALQYLDQRGDSALLADNTILSGLMEQNPGKYRIVELQPTSSEKYAAAIAKGDSGLLNVVNSTIRDFNESEDMALWKAKYEETTVLRLSCP